MCGQTRGRCLFSRMMSFFALFIAGLAFSGCVDPVSGSDDSVPAPPPAPHFELESPFIRSSEDLISALTDPDITEVIIDSSVSLTVLGELAVSAPPGSKKILKIPSTSKVTIHGLSVPAGVTLSLEREPQGSSGQIQIFLDSFKIAPGAALSVGANIQVTLNGSNTVGGTFGLSGGSVIVNKGAGIQGSGGGRISIVEGVIVFLDDVNNNFHKKVGNDLYETIKGSITNPPTEPLHFFWGSSEWMEDANYYPKNIEEFFNVTYSTTYTPASSTLLSDVVCKATDLLDEKILALNPSVKVDIDTLTLAVGARLKLEGSGTLTSKKLVLNQGAVLEVGKGVTFTANEGKGSKLDVNSKIIVRGTFKNNSMPDWSMEKTAEFVFYAGSSVYINISVGTWTQLVGTAADGTGATITLTRDTIVLHSDKFNLLGDAVLNSEFTQPWNGKVYIDGTLDLKAKFTVSQPNLPPKPYFELAENARVNVKNGGELLMAGTPAAGSVKYGKLGKGSRIVVENGGTFRNEIFPNWKHDGSPDNPGAFIFQAGSKVYADAAAFGAGSGELLYIAKGDSQKPVVNLESGQIRLTDKTFALEKGAANKGVATLNGDFKLSSGAKLVVKDSDLTIAKNAMFTVESTLKSEFVTLENANITVGAGAGFTINGPNPLPGGGVKLARLTNSTITVKKGGKFHNGIYPNWKMENAGQFVFESGSTVSIANPDDLNNPLTIIDADSAPIKLEEGAVVTYAHEKISLNGKAHMAASVVKQLWQGFDLIVKQSSELVVSINSKEGLNLDGISIRTEGNPPGKVTYQVK